jgi:hypothetical protein
MADLLGVDELPPSFEYPRQFLRIVELGLMDLEPWWILEDEPLRGHLRSLRTHYPARNLIPFAKRQDNDDIACFVLDSGKISIIHDFASPGWEQRGAGRVFETFYDWLRKAIEDLTESDV